MSNAHPQKTHWVLFLLAWLTYQGGSSPDNPPNVVLIMTDDQGYGDLGFHGNSLIHTPNLDRLAEKNLVHSQFYVSSVRAPTRASLMTGRYHYRTGVVETYRGRAMMYPDEVTLAELLADAGFRTGIFGKWHLGDNYPLRAMDQGFQESLVHRGGGIGKPENVRLDGIRPVSLWKGEQTNPVTRRLFFQTHRGDIPEIGRVSARSDSPCWGAECWSSLCGC